MSDPIVMHWFRRDIRLDDNTALNEAVRTGARVLPVFIVDPVIVKSERFGLPRMAVMLKGLAALDDLLRQRGAGLLVRQGDVGETLLQLTREHDVKTIFFNHDHSPYALKRDERLRAMLAENGVEFRGFDDVLLHAPGTILKKDGSPFVVFSPFRRAWEASRKTAPADLPADAKFYLPQGERRPVPTLADLDLPETIETPDAGEGVALERLDAFIDERIEQYAETRNNITSLDQQEKPLGTSALSFYLRLGMLSPRRAYAAAADSWGRARGGTPKHSAETWITELCWRDFYNHILFHFPYVLESCHRPEYDRVAFRHAPDELRRWKEGQTGYPLIDAAMRSVAALGWMHNRARMVVASFLTKDLLIHFREGDVHFMHMLMDGDLAANNGGWQWAAGTGTDPQPYFRIFNPVSQSEKFDPQGAYIRRWIPELRDVPDEHIHWPHEMTTPPKDYPKPIVDHTFARQRTLDVFKAARVQPDNQPDSVPKAQAEADA